MGSVERLKKESGIALMLTLSALLILTTVVVEFAYNSHVTYEMAANERDRLRAYYLAQSAMNFSRLELMLERRLRSQFASLLQDLQGAGFTSDPLCKQFPFSTDLIKGIASGALTGEKEKPKGEEETSAPPEEGGFFDFDGSFEVSCDTEERKINLNVFRGGATPAPSAIGAASPAAAASSALYDEQKNLLFSFLSQKQFEPYFKGPDEIRKVVTAIADWADPDDQINEAPGVAGGSESSEFSGAEFTYKVKNGKYASVAELLLIPGIGDDVYNLLAPQVTIYGDNKINLCQAPDEVVRAFVLKYSQTAAGASPLRPEDAERMTAVIEAVRNACNVPSPQPAQVAAAISGLVGGGAVAGGAGGSSASGSSSLASQITTTNRFYSIRSSGKVGETEVHLVAVLDTQNPNPNLWKILYFRAE